MIYATATAYTCDLGEYTGIDTALPNGQISAFLSSSKPGTSPFCPLFQILSVPRADYWSKPFSLSSAAEGFRSRDFTFCLHFKKLVQPPSYGTVLRVPTYVIWVFNAHQIAPSHQCRYQYLLQNVSDLTPKRYSSSHGLSAVLKHAPSDTSSLRLRLAFGVRIEICMFRGVYHPTRVQSIDQAIDAQFDAHFLNQVGYLHYSTSTY